MLKQKNRHLINRFANDEGGNVFMITVLVLFVVMSAAGAAMDYSRIVSAKSKMVQAMDAAVLAAGYDLSKGVTDEGDLRAKFEDFFYANITGVGGNPDQYEIASFNADPDTGKVSARVESQVDATLTRIMGMDMLDVVAESAGTFDQTDVEIAMMLDVTGSMGGQKIADLKLAAKDAVDILIPDNNSRGVRIGLVPYASSINAGRLAREVTRGNTSAQVAGLGIFTPNNNVPTNDCVTGRGGRETATETSYRDAPLGSDARSVNASNDFFRCPDAEIIPLTDNRTTLRNEIEAFVADGYTAGHLGIAWSYYLLSEKWRGLFNNANKPAAYSNDVKKIAILMTDGEFNTAYAGVNTNPFGRNVAVSNQVALDLCEDMKKTKNGNPGITVYSIAFQAPASAEATLRTCANEDTDRTTYFYNASSGAELRDAFRAIAADISNLRLSK